MTDFRAPSDKYCMIYLLFVINGIGTLLSWNMFINAADYFINFKFSEEYLNGNKFGPKTNFMQYLTFSSQIPACLFQWMNIFWEVKGGLTMKVLFGTLGISITFLIQIFLAIIDTSDFPMGFFVITLLCAIVSNCCNGIYQNSVFGMSASLPPKFTGAIILGNQVCGTFTSLVEIVSRACSKNSRVAAIYYFLIALISLFVCFDTIYGLPLNKFYRYHKQRQELLQKSSEAVKDKAKFFHLMNQMKLALYDVFGNLFITISCFPAVLVSIQPITGESFLEGYFASVLCFLTFNVTALIGSIIAPKIKRPAQKHLWIFTTARFIFIPIFLFCNYMPNNVKRTWPVFVKSDLAYWIFNVLFGLSNGYGISLSMMYAPGVVEPKDSPQAGMIAAAMLLTGVLSGILVTFIWPIIVAL